jgi:hypothetical protein
MTTPHKHAELIKKWADDDSLVIQFKNSMSNWIIAEHPLWDKDSQYRIKPEVIRYRVVLLKNMDGKSKFTQTVDNNKEHEDIESDKGYFIKWLTDWIEVELDEGEK